MLVLLSPAVAMARECKRVQEAYMLEVIARLTEVGMQDTNGGGNRYDGMQERQVTTAKLLRSAFRQCEGT